MIIWFILLIHYIVHYSYCCLPWAFFQDNALDPCFYRNVLEHLEKTRDQRIEKGCLAKYSVFIKPFWTILYKMSASLDISHLFLLDLFFLNIYYYLAYFIHASPSSHEEVSSPWGKGFLSVLFITVPGT